MTTATVVTQAIALLVIPAVVVIVVVGIREMLKVEL